MFFKVMLLLSSRPVGMNRASPNLDSFPSQQKRLGHLTPEDPDEGEVEYLRSMFT